MNPWAQLLDTQVSYHLRKYLFDILQERYARNQEFVDRLTSTLNTSKDVEGLGRLVSDLYETAYIKAMKDAEEALTQRGLKATIIPHVTPEMIEKHRIFQ